MYCYIRASSPTPMRIVGAQCGDPSTHFTSIHSTPTCRCNADAYVDGLATCGCGIEAVVGQLCDTPKVWCTGLRQW